MIVILGILAVTAAPRFLNLQSDARKATLEATKGALESAFQIFSAKAQVPSADVTVSDSGEKTLTLNGVEFRFTDDSYPIWPIEAMRSLEPLLSIVNLDVHVSDETEYNGLIYEFNPPTKGFILFYGRDGDVDKSRCFISYSPDKSHSDSGIVDNDSHFYMVSDGC